MIFTARRLFLEGFVVEGLFYFRLSMPLSLWVVLFPSPPPSFRVCPLPASNAQEFVFILLRSHLGFFFFATFLVPEHWPFPARPSFSLLFLVQEDFGKVPGPAGCLFLCCFFCFFPLF